MQRIVQQFTPLSWTEYGTAPSTFQRLLERRKAIHVGLCQSYNITYNKQCVTSRRVGRLAFTTPDGGRTVATDCVDGNFDTIVREVTAWIERTEHCVWCLPCPEYIPLGHSLLDQQGSVSVVPSALVH